MFGRHIKMATSSTNSSRFDLFAFILDPRIVLTTVLVDTLGCYPFENEDPFIIHSCPNVFFAGNQPEFDTKLIEGDDGQIVRLVLVPSFYTTQTIVLVNLDTLDCQPIQFK